MGYAVGYPREWLLDGRFVAGAVVFLIGTAVNVTSDYRVAGLRRQQQGLAFAMWTAANLIPRALWRHRWYCRTFPDYPPFRRAVIPGVL